MEYTRVHRLFRLIILIQGSAYLNARRLAELCETSERNIYRDLEMLAGAGVPISFDPAAGGYSLRKDFFLRPVELTLEEAMAVLMLADRVGANEQIPHVAEAGKAGEKLRAILPQKIREMIDEAMPRVVVSLARASNEPTSEVYAIVREAITNRRAVECEYESPKHKAAGNDKSSLNIERFRFDPYSLYFGQRAWFVVGLHHGRGEVRTLKLSRFTRCSSIDRPYLIPDDFSLDRHFGQAWRMVPSGSMHDIQLHFDAAFAETVADTHWHDSQEVDWNEDGSIEMRFRVDGLEEIVWWIMGYGPHCRVSEPEELRQRVAELLVKATALY
jgi:predicted DNA-binding transcriptional regulator YafY